MPLPPRSEATLQAALDALPKEKLVSFLADLAANVPDVPQRLETLIALEDGTAGASLAKKRIAALRRGGKHLWGFEGAQTVAADYEAVLELIERSVLPSAPEAALRLAAAVIETDGVAFERADDSYGHIGDVFRQAAALFGRAAKGCSAAVVLPLLNQLQTENAYGARDPLLRETAAALPEAVRAEIIATYRAQLGSDDKALQRAASFALESIADATADPVLYEEACFSRELGLSAGAMRLKVAQHYLAAGRADDALARLPPTADECWGGDWATTRIGILRALGRTTELKEALWERFQSSISTGDLRAWLESAPETEHEAMYAQAKEEVLTDRHYPVDQARYFFAHRDADRAAACIMARLELCRGELYDQLVPLAKAFEPSHPLVASALYRKLLEATVEKALSKYYHHGAKYWRALEKLAPAVAQWDPLTPHSEYTAHFRNQHARKTAFWRTVAN